MGHRRVGYLPKSQRWRTIVGEIGQFADGGATVAEIAKHTTEGARAAFDRFDTENSLQTAFHFLVAISVAAGTDKPASALAEIGIHASSDASALSIAGALREQLALYPTSEEKALVERAAIDSLGEWLGREAAESANDLFGADTKTAFQLLKRASNGAGFCELSRIFFGRFTKNFLTYFLDREASAAIPNPAERDDFARALESHVDFISRHAFETAKITQSFAAGWFNKNAIDHIPPKSSVRGFVRHALGKLREELRREGQQ